MSPAAQRIDVVGVGGGAPHRTPVQAGRRRAALMSRGQLAERRARRHQLPRPHRRPQPARSWSAGRRGGPPTPRPTGELPGEHHRPRPCGIHRLARHSGQVNAAMPALPVRRWRVEQPHNRRSGPQRPVQPAAIGLRGRRARHRDHQRSPPPCAYAQLSASPPGMEAADTAHLGIEQSRCGQSTCWHGVNSDLQFASSGLTSRACAAAPLSSQGCIRVPGGPEWRTPLGSGTQQTPGPGITRRRAATDN